MFIPILSSTPSDSKDLSADLLPQLSQSSSAVDLRKFLSRLLVLVAQGRISSRRAAVLSHITHQLLHSTASAPEEHAASPLKSSCAA